ncbi:DEAD/DEAH box helicase [Streptomyces sp. NPDC020898]|uniref:DEAD/DEAH box helicase n=1 Tax=Streptomyces sp. NPDC020898 TaxID=3365101 RepID=UPI0037A39B24
MNRSFADLGLPPSLLASLTVEGITVPFPIQSATLPDSLAGLDVMGRGQTGSGKTLAFGLALLARIAGQRSEAGRPLALVLVPTRELAQQVVDALTPHARALELRMTTIVGGLPIARQARALAAGTEVVIATPGRLRDLVDRGDCRLDRVAITVLDEADQMVDMGFLPQVTRLLDLVPRKGQRMLFSATLDADVGRLARRYLHEPVVHQTDPHAGAVTTMEHHVLYVDDVDKKTVATEIAARDGRVLMFMDTRRSVDRLTKHLLKSGVRAGALHGGRSQPQRTRTLAQFKTGEVTVLVASDVAARGIHIDDLDLVVNVDPPGGAKDYLHRGGRTARAGASGSVVTLVLPEQRREMRTLTKAAGVNPNTAKVSPGGAELTRITGARTPSGIPVVLPTPAPTPPAAPKGDGSGRSRSSRSRSGAGTGAGGGSRSRRGATEGGTATARTSGGGGAAKGRTAGGAAGARTAGGSAKKASRPTGGGAKPPRTSGGSTSARTEPDAAGEPRSRRRRAPRTRRPGSDARQGS